MVRTGESTSEPVTCVGRLDPHRVGGEDCRWRRSAGAGNEAQIRLRYDICQELARSPPRATSIRAPPTALVLAFRQAQGERFDSVRGEFVEPRPHDVGQALKGFAVRVMAEACRAWLAGLPP